MIITGLFALMPEPPPRDIGKSIIGYAQPVKLADAPRRISGKVQDWPVKLACPRKGPKAAFAAAWDESTGLVYVSGTWCPPSDKDHVGRIIVASVGYLAPGQKQEENHE